MGKKKFKNPEIVWQCRSRNKFGLPFTRTKYILYENKLVIRRGIINVVEDEVELYKIKDKQVHINFLGRIFNYGTIYISASAVYNQENCIKNVKNVREVMSIFEHYIDTERDKYHVRGRDMVGEAENHNPDFERDYDEMEVDVEDVDNDFDHEDDN